MAFHGMPISLLQDVGELGLPVRDVVPVLVAQRHHHLFIPFSFMAFSPFPVLVLGHRAVEQDATGQLFRDFGHPKAHEGVHGGQTPRRVLQMHRIPRVRPAHGQMARNRRLQRPSLRTLGRDHHVRRVEEPQDLLKGGENRRSCGSARSKRWPHRALKASMTLSAC